MRLNEDDIKLLGEGQQMSRLILSAYDSYDDFIIKNNLVIAATSIESYAKKKKITSHKFRVALTMAFNKSYDELILDKKSQIIKYIDIVTDNINDYNDINDAQIFLKLKQLCIENEMTIELGRVYWIYGHFYYYNLKKRNTGIEFMELAITHVNSNPKLLVEYHSHLGLVFYYERNFDLASRYFDDARKLIIKIPLIDNKTKYLNYYRYGILLNNTNKQLKARENFKAALEYAENDIVKGCALMNIGLTYKRCNEYSMALDYYKKAQELLQADGVKLSVVFNNIAEIYSGLGYYEDAKNYIDSAFKCLNNQNEEKYFVYFATYAQIMVNSGNSDKSIEKLLELIDLNKDTIHKTYIIEAIKCLSRLLYQNKDISSLMALDDVVSNLYISCEIESDYRAQLLNCIGDIYMKMKSLRGGELFEK